MDEPASLYPRPLQGPLLAALADTPAVAIIGPRQCGKSTLAQTCAPDRSYVSLDDEALLRTARDDPSGFVASLPDPVTLDEVQHAQASSARSKDRWIGIDGLAAFSSPARPISCSSLN
jgi:hypothetical protein